MYLARFYKIGLSEKLSDVTLQFRCQKTGRAAGGAGLQWRRCDGTGEGDPGNSSQDCWEPLGPDHAGPQRFVALKLLIVLFREN